VTGSSSRLIAVAIAVGLAEALAAQQSPNFVTADRVAVRLMREISPIELAPGVQVRTVVGSTGSFSVGDFAGGSSAPLHHHTREQADVGIDGVFDMTIGTHVEAIAPDAAVIVPPNVAHSLANTRAVPATVIEFHTVRRPDLVPPRPAITFPSSPTPVFVPDDRRLVAPLDRPGDSQARTIRGKTCTLTWRRISRSQPPAALVATSVELFVYVVRGSATLSSADGHQPLNPGTLVVIPARQRAAVQAANDVALVEFSPERF
jgi:mannose-6-phosphate isomerase-like protein (cupin superfamily)